MGLPCRTRMSFGPLHGPHSDLRGPQSRSATTLNELTVWYPDIRKTMYGSLKERVVESLIEYQEILARHSYAVQKAGQKEADSMKGPNCPFGPLGPGANNTLHI